MISHFRIEQTQGHEPCALTRKRKGKHVIHRSLLKRNAMFKNAGANEMASTADFTGKIQTLWVPSLLPAFVSCVSSSERSQGSSFSQG